MAKDKDDPFKKSQMSLLGPITTKGAVVSKEKPSLLPNSTCFPQKELKQSVQMKKKLQVRYAISAQAAPETHSMMQSNGRTRFILKLREKAADLEKMAEILQEREKSDADSLERKWNAAKAISKSARFARYIEDLQDHGNNDKELQSMVKEATLIQAILCPENVSASESLDMSKATTQEASTSTISPLHKSILELRQEIDASPFKPKEKSLLRKIILDEFLENYVFGNSSHTNEDLQVEFGRTFRDLVTLGVHSRERWTRALIDKEEFNIRKDGFSQLDQEEAYLRIEELTNKLGSNLSPSTVTLKQLETRDNPAIKFREAYRLSQVQQMSALREQLDQRKKERFNVSKQPETVLPVLRLIDLDLRHTIPKKNQSVWSGVLPHLWVADPHSTFIGVKKARTEELRRQRRAGDKSIATTTSRSSGNTKSQDLTVQQPRQRRVSFIPALNTDGGSLRSSLPSLGTDGSPVSMTAGSSNTGGPGEPRSLSKWLQVKKIVNVLQAITL